MPNAVFSLLQNPLCLSSFLGNKRLGFAINET